MSEEQLDIFDDDAENQEVEGVDDLGLDGQEGLDQIEGLSGDDYGIDEAELEKLLKSDEPSKKVKREKKSPSGNEREHKPQKPRNSKKEEEQQQIMQKIKDEVQKIKKEMRDIHQRDVKAVKDQKPPLNKVKHIDDIVSKLSKLSVQREFVQEKGIDCLTDWLDRIPNGPEPSVTLRKKLLQFIYELNVNRRNLSGIRLGKVIYKLSQKSDIKDIRILANKIVEKWSKIINSKDRDDDNDDDYQ